MTEVVSFVETVPTEACLWAHDDSFSFNRARGWVAVQRICFWLLRRIGAFHFSEWTSYRRVDVEPEVSMREILRQQAHLANDLGRGGEILLVGADDWEEMLDREPLWYNPMAFDGEYFVPRYEEAHHTAWGVRDYPQRKRMRVCVIPWMRGMVLVPREALITEESRNVTSAHRTG